MTALDLRPRDDAGEAGLRRGQRVLGGQVGRRIAPAKGRSLVEEDHPRSLVCLRGQQLKAQPVQARRVHHEHGEHAGLREDAVDVVRRDIFERDLGHERQRDDDPLSQLSSRDDRPGEVLGQVGTAADARVADVDLGLRRSGALHLDPGEARIVESIRVLAKCNQAESVGHARSVRDRLDVVTAPQNSLRQRNSPCGRLAFVRTTY
jgi:hypothetical protein